MEALQKYCFKIGQASSTQTSSIYQLQPVHCLHAFKISQGIGAAYAIMALVDMFFFYIYLTQTYKMSCLSK